MFSEFKNLREMMAAYSDEDKCRAYMEQMRWGGNPTCPFCGMHNPYKLKDGKHTAANFLPADEILP